MMSSLQSAVCEAYRTTIRRGDPRAAFEFAVALVVATDPLITAAAARLFVAVAVTHYDAA